MTIDSLVDTSVYFEKKVPLSITCNSTQNNDGVLKVDNNNNNLLSIIDSGDTMLGRLTSYSDDNAILFHNPTTNNIRIVRVGDDINLPIDFIQGTRYYLNAKILIGAYEGDYTFNTNLTEDVNIFKIFLDDGREIKSYLVDNGKIRVTGTDRLYVNDLSEIILYTYKSTHINDALTFKIDYMGYSSIYDEHEFLDGDYFDTIIGMEINNFESLEISQNVTNDIIKKDFYVSSKSIVNTVENSIIFDLFNISGVKDVVTSFDGVEFRIILCNRHFGRVTIVNNCRLDDSISLIYEKEKNKKKFNVLAGNYIDINLSTPSYYGLDKYGTGNYGIGKQIFNSSRRGGN